MVDEQKRPIDNSDADSSLARAGDPLVHMEVVLFDAAADAPGNVLPRIVREHPETQTAPAAPVPAALVVLDEQLLRDELLGNDSLGG